MSNANPSGSTRFWLIPSHQAARISVSPGCHVIADLTVRDGCMVEISDRELNDNESLREAIQAALDGGKAEGYMGEETLEQARAEADKAWDAAHSSDRAGTAYEIVKTPAWLQMLREAGAL